MPEFSMYSSILFIHVVSALILVATSLFAPLTLRQIRGARTLRELEAWVEFERRSTKWNPLAAFVLLGTGVYLGSVGFWTDGWFFVSLAAWVMSTALAVAIIGRTAGALQSAGATPGEAVIPAALDALRWSKAWTAANGAMIANDLAVLYLMFNKPGLTASMAVLVFANGGAVGFSLLRHRSAAAAHAAVIS